MEPGKARYRGKGDRFSGRGAREWCEMHLCSITSNLEKLLRTGEPDALKGARPVCAVRRVVVSLLQAGRTREDVLGLSVYLETKVEGDKSRLRKRCLLESVVGWGNRTTRSLWVELDCPNSNPDGVKVRTHRNNACNRCHALFWHEPEAGRLL